MTAQDIRRAFSTATASIDSSISDEMTLEDVNRLHRLQTEFEKDPQNVQNAYELFAMLNRHGKYNTVIRLYDKHELAYSSTKDTYTERMNS